MTAGADFLVLFPICRDTKQIYTTAGYALRDFKVLIGGNHVRETLIHTSWVR